MFYKKFDYSYLNIITELLQIVNSYIFCRNDGALTDFCTVCMFVQKLILINPIHFLNGIDFYFLRSYNIYRHYVRKETAAL